MDMQNVSNLVIPEGEVRTIHDKSSRLLWGKLSYDTKYAGDTIQDGAPTPDAPVTIQTVTGVQTVKVCGKNLLKIPDGSFTSQGLSVKRLDNTITVSGKYTSSNNYKSLLNSNGTTVNLDRVLPAGTYTVSMSQAPAKRLEFSLYNSSNVRICHEYLDGTYSTFTLNETATGIRLFINGLSNNLDVNSNYTNLQIEAGTTHTAYEPYQSHDYTVDLGTIELCKIGNYQDYIYKGADGWYVHKEMGKYTFASDDNWSTIAYGTNSWGLPNKTPNFVFDTSQLNTICEISKSVSYNNRASGDSTQTCVCYIPSNGTINIRNTSITTKEAMQSAAEGADIYYWRTPEDTEITDNTLISQLNAIHQFLTRYGYNSTVSGNLPLIISKTNL